MAGLSVSVQVTGDAAIVAKLNPARAIAPKRRFLTRSSIVVQSNARKNAPVDTGRLRNSIAYEISGDSARIGPNAVYGIFVEKGTRPHFPPVSAVAGWAGRHGTTAFAVARGIAAHGTRPQPYMAPAFRQSIPAVQSHAVVLGREIVASIAGGG